MSKRQPYLGTRTAQKGRVPYLGDRHANVGRTPYLGGSGHDKTVTVDGPAPHKHHRGLLGSVAHAVADKTERAAHDIKSIPGGIVGLTRDEYGALKQTVKHPIVSGTHDPNYVGNTKAGKKVAADVHGMVHSTVESVKHPLRDPFMTALNVLPVAHGVAGAAARGAAVARTGELGAALRPYEPAPRLIQVGDHQVPLHPSKSPLVRAGQRVYDKALQHAVDTKPNGRLASHATKRVGGSIDETVRYQHRLREVPAQLLQAAAKRLAPTGGRVPGTTANRFQRLEQAALELTSVNTTPERAAAYHAEQAANGVNPELNRAVSKLYTAVHQRGMLKTNEHGDVIVDAAKHPLLARTDFELARVHGKGDEILARYGVRTPEALQAAIDAPGRYREGAHYETPTPAKHGVPSPALLRQRSQVARLEQLHERAVTKAQQGKFSPEQRALIAASDKLPAGVEELATRPRTVDEARAHLAKLDERYNAFIEKLYEKKLTPGEMAEQREINQSNGKFRKQQAGTNKSYHGTYKVQRIRPNVSDAKRMEAEAEAHKLAEKHSDMPAAQKFLKLSRTRDELRAAIGAHEEEGMFGGTSDAPLGDVAKKVREPRVHPSELPLPSGKVVTAGGKIVSPEGSARADRLGGALSVARDRLEQMEQAAARRVKPTGVIGGTSARPGRGHVSYAGSEPTPVSGLAAHSSSPVVGEVRSPITSHANTGANIARGVVPKDVTGQAARTYHQIVRFLNTSEHRALAVKTGSDVRQTERDVLVKIPGAHADKIPAAVDEILGRSKLSNDDVAGIDSALRAYTEDLIPGLRDNFAADRGKGLGHPAPDGYVWVDRNVLGHLGKPTAGPRGRVVRTADSTNSAVTGATVYFKIGHIGTRALTNATTNIIQGSAAPSEIARSVNLWHELSLEDKRRALAAAGQHGMEAMPHTGQNLVGRAAGAGARWWARHIDAPFRFNSIAYEARQAGIRTPRQFRTFLDRLERPDGLTPEQFAKVDAVAKRANRAGIAYDRLSDAERRFVTRGVWFYPWIKGSTMFAGHTLAEHPYKSAVLAQAGEQGRQRQERDLGDLPTYEGGLFKLAGGADHPLVADFSTFSPFATPADALGAVSRPAELSNFLNPVADAGTHLIFGLDQNGQPTTHPVTSALETLVSPTPEAQILTGFRHRHDDTSRRMFPKSPALFGTRDALLRALVGPGLPRRLNTRAGHSAAARERTGR